MFNFNQSETESADFETVVHLRDAAESLGIDSTAFAFGLDETADSETLESIRSALIAAIAESERLAELRKRPPCYIGPYSGGRCEICGLADPN